MSCLFPCCCSPASWTSRASPKRGGEPSTLLSPIHSSAYLQQHCCYYGSTPSVASGEQSQHRVETRGRHDQRPTGEGKADGSGGVRVDTGRRCRRCRQWHRGQSADTPVRSKGDAPRHRGCPCRGCGGYGSSLSDQSRWSGWVGGGGGGGGIEVGVSRDFFFVSCDSSAWTTTFLVWFGLVRFGFW